MPLLDYFDQIAGNCVLTMTDRGVIGFNTIYRASRTFFASLRCPEVNR